VLTDDNPLVGDEIRANLSHVSCLLEVSKVRSAQDIKGKNPAAEERAVALGILGCGAQAFMAECTFWRLIGRTGILRNLAPFQPPSSIASVDLDKEILFPALLPVVSSVSLQEATNVVQGFVKLQVFYTFPPIPYFHLQ
jgi:hypothetical protein